MKICMRLFETFSNNVPHAFIPITYLKQGTPILRTHITLSKGKRQEVRASTHFFEGQQQNCPYSSLQLCFQNWTVAILYIGILHYLYVLYSIWYYFMHFSFPQLNSIWLLPFYAFGAKIPVFWVLWVYKRAAF